MSRDNLESWANAILGFAISWAAVHVLWPIYGWPVNGQAVSVSLIFFCLSWGRSRALRYVFRRCEQ